MKKFLACIVLAIALLLLQDVSAQCAMCKAVAETSQNGGSGIADGLNNGIVYLMFFPYLLMGAVGIALYKHRKSKGA